MVNGMRGDVPWSSEIKSVLYVYQQQKFGILVYIITGEEVSIDKQVACEECPRWLKMTEVAWEKTSCRYIFFILKIEIGSFHGS